MSASSTVMRSAEVSEPARCGRTLRVEGQAFLEQVDRERVGIRVERRERLLLFEGQRAEVVAGPRRGDLVEVVEAGRAEDLEDERELVVVVAPWKERAPGQHLGEDAADRPHVDRFLQASAPAGGEQRTVYSLKVSCSSGQLSSLLDGRRAGDTTPTSPASHHDLRRAVPARGDVFGHEASRLGVAQDGRSREAKVADLQVAVGVEQQVGRLHVSEAAPTMTRLEIAMQHGRRVQRFEAAEGLVDAAPSD